MENQTKGEVYLAWRTRQRVIFTRLGEPDKGGYLPGLENQTKGNIYLAWRTRQKVIFTWLGKSVNGFLTHVAPDAPIQPLKQIPVTMTYHGMPVTGNHQIPAIESLKT